MGKLEKTVISVLFWCWKQEMHIRVNIKFAFSFDHSYHPKNMHNNSISLQLLLHHYLTKLLQRVDYIQYYYHLSKITHPCHPLQLRRVEKQTDSFNTIWQMNEKYAQSNMKAQRGGEHWAHSQKRVQESFSEEKLLQMSHDGLLQIDPVFQDVANAKACRRATVVNSRDCK